MIKSLLLFVLILLTGCTSTPEIKSDNELDYLDISVNYIPKYSYEDYHFFEIRFFNQGETPITITQAALKEFEQHQLVKSNELYQYIVKASGFVETKVSIIDNLGNSVSVVSVVASSAIGASSAHKNFKVGKPMQRTKQLMHFLASEPVEESFNEKGFSMGHLNHAFIIRDKEIKPRFLVIKASSSESLPTNLDIQLKSSNNKTREVSIKL